MPELAAGILFGALVIYGLTGGADYGAGIWSLLARLRGERRTAEAAEAAIGPIWEANHVWVIFALVVMFVAFPPAFADLSVKMGGPLSLALVGIVLRGTAYVMQAYGGGGRVAVWRRIFGWASLITPFMFGLVAGALALGQGAEPGGPLAGSFAVVSPFSVLCGVMAMTLFAHLAAVYLTVEVELESVREMYRLYGMLSGAALGVCALVSVVALYHTPGGASFAQNLILSPGALVWQTGAGVAALTTLWWLYHWKFRLARRAVVALALAIFAGWGASQYPWLIPGAWTIRDAAAESAVLRMLLLAVAAGGAVTAPLLWWLFRLFKGRAAE